MVGASLILATALSNSVARADGGVVRLREAQEHFIVTIFSPHDVSRGLPAELTVMVQQRDTGAVVLDAAVDLSLAPPADARLTPGEVLCGAVGNSRSAAPTGAPGQPPSFHSTRPWAANKLLYGASVVFGVAGDWRLRVTVRRENDVANVSCPLVVGLGPRRLAGLWPCLALPPIVIAFFLMNQWLRLSWRARLRGREDPALGKRSAGTASPYLEVHGEPRRFFNAHSDRERGRGIEN